MVGYDLMYIVMHVLALHCCSWHMDLVAFHVDPKAKKATCSTLPAVLR